MIDAGAVRISVPLALCLICCDAGGLAIVECATDAAGVPPCDGGDGGASACVLVNPRDGDPFCDDAFLCFPPPPDSCRAEPCDSYCGGASVAYSCGDLSTCGPYPELTCVAARMNIQNEPDLWCCAACGE